MDPTTTLIMIHNAVVTRDYAQAVSSIAHYYQWRLKGGAEPDPLADEYVASHANQLADLLEDFS